MQTSREPLVELCGTQEPILRIEQLAIGAIITGVAMQYAWQVVDTRDGNAWLMQMPYDAGTICAPDAHTFQAFGRGHVCQRCRLRTQGMQEFLPRTENKPRAYVIAPTRGQIQRPQPYTLYGGLQGNVLKTVWLTSPTQWNEALPLIPALHVLWTIPPALRTLVEHIPADEVELEEED